MTERYITIKGKKHHLISTSITKRAAMASAANHNGIVRKLSPSQARYEGAVYGVYSKQGFGIFGA